MRQSTVSLLSLTRVILITCFLSRTWGFAFVDRLSSRRTESTCSLSAVSKSICVGLTREEGKNDKLRQALLECNDTEDDYNWNVVELPCIAHATGPDLDRLEASLSSGSFDTVVVTSPEAARVLGPAWESVFSANDNSSMQPPVIAAVGKATEQELEQLGLSVQFCPTKATAATLVQELPSTSIRVLYPASRLAATTLQEGLQARGMEVVRLNTYDTVPAVWTPKQEALADTVQIVCFASPSAVKAWVDNTKCHDDKKAVLAACIGETSATACRKHGWLESDIYYPEKPGVPGWVSAVQQASRTLLAASSIETQKEVQQEQQEHA